MKEILKYLRTINSYSQEKVATEVGISRQSYNKYEAGTVVPSKEMVEKLAKLYGVQTDFILNNKVPDLPGNKNDVTYAINKKSAGIVSEPEVAYSANDEISMPKVLPVHKNHPRTYEAYFSKDAVHVIGTNFPFTEGQRLKVTIEEETEEEEQKRKEAAWAKIQSMIGKFKLPEELENLSYDEIRRRALEEKYGPF